MAIKDQLLTDMKAAMKEKEAGKLKLTTIRMARAAIKYIEIDKGKELNDEDVIEVLAKEVKQRRDSIEEYTKYNREDIVEQLNQEVSFLMNYLPKQLSLEEIRELAKEAVAQTGAQEPKDMGKVMGALMPKVKGKADGKAVNQIVREFLS